MAKKQLAYLEYTFIFEPQNTWQSGTAFERSLADFFAAHGLEAEIIETVGNVARRVIEIKKMDDFLNFETPPAKSPKESLKDVNKNIPTGKKVKK